MQSLLGELIERFEAFERWDSNWAEKMDADRDYRLALERVALVPESELPRFLQTKPGRQYAWAVHTAMRLACQIIQLDGLDRGVDLSRWIPELWAGLNRAVTARDLMLACLASAVDRQEL